ncbi:MAG: PrsW family intramembrane metalloprotease [Bacteroidales bacterium]|nr:PrsW family intramembrane metalloprotease [Bacteroidales bacterium]
MELIFIALTPVFIIAFYIFYRDKYEKEPVLQLTKALFAGVLISMPVIFVERLLSVVAPIFGLLRPAYDAFIVAAFTEELFKFIALYFLFWKNPDFSEKFDGLVYAVFVSLGFAGFENILYVINGGILVGWTRAITAVPAHALFGVVMGYYFGMAKFFPAIKSRYLQLSFMLPWLLHGIYDLILMSGHPVLLWVFIPFIIFLWITGFRRMKMLSDNRSWTFKEKS